MASSAMHQERRKTRSATAAPLHPQPAAASVLEPKVSEQAWNPAAVTDGVLLLGKGGDALKRFPSVRSLATPAQREQWIKDELPGLAFSIVTYPACFNCFKKLFSQWDGREKDLACNIIYDKMDDLNQVWGEGVTNVAKLATSDPLIKAFLGREGSQRCKSKWEKIRKRFVSPQERMERAQWRISGFVGLEGVKKYDGWSLKLVENVAQLLGQGFEESVILASLRNQVLERLSWIDDRKNKTVGARKISANMQTCITPVSDDISRTKAALYVRADALNAETPGFAARHVQPEPVNTELLRRFKLSVGRDGILEKSSPKDTNRQVNAERVDSPLDGQVETARLEPNGKPAETTADRDAGCQMDSNGKLAETMTYPTTRKQAKLKRKPVKQTTNPDSHQQVNAKRVDSQKKSAQAAQSAASKRLVVDRSNVRPVQTSEMVGVPSNIVKREVESVVAAREEGPPVKKTKVVGNGTELPLKMDNESLQRFNKMAVNRVKAVAHFPIKVLAGEDVEVEGDTKSGWVAPHPDSLSCSCGGEADALKYDNGCVEALLRWAEQADTRGGLVCKRHLLWAAQRLELDLGAFTHITLAPEDVLAKMARREHDQCCLRKRWELDRSILDYRGVATKERFLEQMFWKQLSLEQGPNSEHDASKMCWEVAKLSDYCTRLRNAGALYHHNLLRSIDCTASRRNAGLFESIYFSAFQQAIAQHPVVWASAAKQCQDHRLIWFPTPLHTGTGRTVHMMAPPLATLEGERLRRAHQFLLPVGRDCAVIGLRRTTTERMFGFVNATKETMGDQWRQLDLLPDFGVCHEAWGLAVEEGSVGGLFAMTAEEVSNPTVLTADTLYSLEPDAVWSYVEKTEEIPVVHIVLLPDDKRDHLLAKGVMVGDAAAAHSAGCLPGVDLGGNRRVDHSRSYHPFEALVQLNDPIHFALRALRTWHHPSVLAQVEATFKSTFKSKEEFNRYKKEVEDTLVNQVRAAVECIEL